MTGIETATGGLTLDRVQMPIEDATGLPNVCYTDARYFTKERDTVIARSWSAVGFAKDVPQAGDAVPIDLMGQPLVMVRGRDQQVRVFHNVCSHRGMILVKEPTRLRGTIRCPYHSWCYSLDGALKSTPSIGGADKNHVEGFSRDDHGLKEVRSVAFMGVIFVDLSGEAPEFSDAMQPLMSRWQEFMDCPFYHGGEESGFQLEVKCNWKLAVENYCESYHLPWVHPGLNSYSRLEDHYHIGGDDHGSFSGQGTLVYRPILGEAGLNFPTLDHLSAKWDTAGEYISLYPNCLLGVHKDHFFAIVLIPVAPDKTIERVEIFYFDEAVKTDAYASLRASNARLWQQVFEEDIFAVEGMQEGRQSPGFKGGVFSPVMDGPTHDFHKWVAAKIAEAA